MSYATEHIAKALKDARENKGLSQRALSEKAGVPQGHISKIENNAVDLRLSSLVSLARALDLELTLVPRKAVPAVQSITRSNTSRIHHDAQAAQAAAKELNRLQSAIANVGKAFPNIKEFAQLQRQVRELKHFQFAIPNLDALRSASKVVQQFQNNTKSLDALRKNALQLQDLRNALAHASADTPLTDTVRPTYSLDEDDHG